MAARHSITVFAVADVDATAGFYERVFGWPRAAEFPGIWVEFESSSSHHLAFYSRGGFGSMAGRTPIDAPAAPSVTASELYVLVDDEAELDEVTARLRAEGAACTSERAERPWGDMSEYFRDPNGNVIAVAYALPH